MAMFRQLFSDALHLAEAREDFGAGHQPRIDEIVQASFGRLARVYQTRPQKTE
jgi:hypothetical protein